MTRSHRAQLISRCGLALLGALLPLRGVATDLQIVLTFDDLPAQRAQHLPRSRVIQINDRLVRFLSREQIPAIGFVNENKLEIDGSAAPELVALLEQWLIAGLELGNHTYSHPDLHRTSLDSYQQDTLRGERLTRDLAATHGLPLRYFRHPFLHTGLDLETKQRFESFLADHGYQIAPVTIDNSEWIFARAYNEALDRQDAELQKRLGAMYINYMNQMVAYYENQSQAILGRQIPQVLLLHANAINAHYLPDVVEDLRQHGYRFVTLEKALSDPAYGAGDLYTGPAGVTWLHRWAIARELEASVFAGEPRTPQWVQDLAGMDE